MTAWLGESLTGKMMFIQRKIDSNLLLRKMVSTVINRLLGHPEACYLCTNHAQKFTLGVRRVRGAAGCPGASHQITVKEE